MNHFSTRARRAAAIWNSHPLAVLILPVIISFAIYARTIASTDFIRDDAYIIASNGLLGSVRLLPRLLSTGYWEGAMGSVAPVQEYRPALMLSFFLNRAVLGTNPWGYHLVNVLLHAGVAVALFAALKRFLKTATAALAAALFLTLPVHVESVAYIVGRSEILVLLFLLLSWIDLERSREHWRRGLLWFMLALLTKEQAVVFPILLAASDWMHKVKRNWVHATLWLVVTANMALRLVVLGRPFHGGHDYFADKGALVRLLTVAKFWVLHYAVPLVTGSGLCSDYSRPLIPDSAAGDVFAWLCLAFWVSLLLATTYGLWRKRPLGLLGIVFFLPVLPTSHLILKLDTIGAERFLYTPSIVVCVLAALALERLRLLARSLALVLLLTVYSIESAARAEIWRSEMAYAQASVRDNPVSAGARSTLGLALLRNGRAVEGETNFRKALELNPKHPAAYFNLGRLYYDQGRIAEADRMLAQVTGDAADADVWVMRALIAERRGQLDYAATAYDRALTIRPWDATAHFNLGRLALATGHPAISTQHFRRYLEIAPEASDAPQVRELLEKRR